VTPQEQQLLMQLTQRINQTPLQEKDPDAENLLGRELGANSDALYIMAQTVLVQNIALEQARAQLLQLQQQLQQARQQQPPAHATSFLGRLLGERDQPQAPPPPPQYQPQQPQQAGWQPVPNAAPPYQQGSSPYYPQSQYMAVPAGQPSFLRGAMQTAAGVAAGALAFEGVESILHGFGRGGGWGGPGMAGFGVGPGGGFGGGFERPIEETVVNNYYDQPGPIGSGDDRVNRDLDRDFGGGEHQAHDPGGQFGPGAGGPFGQFDQGGPAQFSKADYNASSANDNAGAFDQGAYDNGMENDTVAADNSLDNMQIDDSGSGFDDGGAGLDDGGGFDNSGGDGF
jgi:uncharacterized protein